LKKSTKGDIDAVMKITGLDIKAVEMKLEQPYTIAYETISSVTNIFIQIKTNKGIIGYGCAAPDKAVTGETPGSVLDSLHFVIKPSLINKDPFRIIKILEMISKNIPHQPSVLAAIDMALYDILGKATNLPLWILLGGYRNCIKTSVTIGIMNVDKTIREAQRLANLGFTCLKIKGGLDVHEDIKRVIEVRKELGKQIELRFDGNQGYDVTDSLLFINKTKQAHLELIEQPTPKNQLHILQQITSKAPLPIMADESIMNLRDAFRLARKDVVDMVNVKLMKVGGISEALQINAVARSARLEVMVGCMDEAELSIAAGLHFALSHPNIVYADLDGHIGLSNDSTKGILSLKNGILYPSAQPGIGFIPTEDWIFD
jgi:L-Ala-D/L-Glu epimerase